MSAETEKEESVKGIVRISNTVKGVGFIDGENSTRYFFHQSDLKMPPGFRAIAVGKDVDFTASTKDGRPVAKEVKPVNGTGVQVASPLPKAIMVDTEGVVILRVDTLDRIFANEDLFPFGEFVIAPSVWGPDNSFRAFRTGGAIKRFTVRTPRPTTDRIFLVLDPDKGVLFYEDGEFWADLGSYLLSLEANGSLRIQCMGKRYQQEKGGGNWVVLEHRLRHTLDFQQEIEGQLPTSGLARDNDGFIPAIKEAITLLNLNKKVAAS